MPFLLNRVTNLFCETEDVESEEVFEEKKQDLFNLMKEALQSQETDVTKGFESIKSL